MTYIIHIDKDKQETALAQIRQIEGVRVEQATDVETGTGDGESDTSAGDEDVLASIQAGSKEVEDARQSGNTLQSARSFLREL